MNKKGLTFMSFAIAVICLGVVLIIVWPKINKIIEDSYENIFSTKVKDMITGVGKTYVQNDKRIFSNVIEDGAEVKDVPHKYEYIIIVNDFGKVASFKVTNGKYKVEGTNDDGVVVDEIGKQYKITHAASKLKYHLTSSGNFEEK